MRQFISATVTLDDLKTYFKGEHWRSTLRDDGIFEGRSNSYYVELSPGGSPAFHVRAQAYEDSSDKDEAVTDDPMKFLVDFLKTGSAGDEVLQKMSSMLAPAFEEEYVPPVVLANILRAWAMDAEEGLIGPRALARVLRHASLLPDMFDNMPLLLAAVHIAARED